ncbi:tellurium resistance protein TerW [Chania multitudinisentens RB-25]|uniref:Tellurium resistance protein TerW n=1 Tax=Chania multitudinisentens RB-25 TaxID=1441930 RepID=W0LEL6_9GAMM|nr:tellurium resistance protein TerW [Chania multitudinisentens]AHG20365.1 tellurium resistance protein TerW [Chania multitudinisentens RB-25]
MQLNTRQTRIYTLANILGSGKPVSAARIITLLNCSEPTLTRALKELRESYSAEIKYSKATHSYQLIQPGQLDKKTLRRMHETLLANSELKTGETVSRVYLDKEKKKAVSLSLKMSVLRKIDRLSRISETTRSEAVEMLVGCCLDELVRDIQARKKGAN